MTDFEQWKQKLSNMNFELFAKEIKNKMLDSNMDDLSKQQFSDCFDYMYKLYQQGKPLEPKLLKIYLEDIKGYKNIKLEDMVRIVLLMGLCGFHIKQDKNN